MGGPPHANNEPSHGTTGNSKAALACGKKIPRTGRRGVDELDAALKAIKRSQHAALERQVRAFSRTTGASPSQLASSSHAASRNASSASTTRASPGASVPSSRQASGASPGASVPSSRHVSGAAAAERGDNTDRLRSSSRQASGAAAVERSGNTDRLRQEPRASTTRAPPGASVPSSRQASGAATAERSGNTDHLRQEPRASSAGASVPSSDAAAEEDGSRQNSPLLPSKLFEKKGTLRKLETGRSSQTQSTAGKAPGKRPLSSDTRASSRARKAPAKKKCLRKNPMPNAQYNDTRKYKREFREQFRLVPDVVECMMRKLHADPAARRKLCCFLPSDRAQGRGSFYNPAFQLGTAACHSEVLDLKGLNVLIGESRDASRSNPMQTGTVASWYLGVEDKYLVEGATAAATISNRRRAMTVCERDVPQAFVNIKLEKPFSGKPRMGDFSKPNLQAARAHGKFFKLENEVFILRKTAQAILEGGSARDVACIDRDTFADINATYERKLAQVEARNEGPRCEGGDRKHMPTKRARSKASHSPVRGRARRRAPRDASSSSSSSSSSSNESDDSAQRAAGAKAARESSSDNDSDNNAQRGGGATAGARESGDSEQRAAGANAGARESSSDDSSDDSSDSDDNAQRAGGATAGARESSGSDTSSESD